MRVEGRSITFGTRVRWNAIQKLLARDPLGVVLDIGSGKSVLWGFAVERCVIWVNLDLQIDRPQLDCIGDGIWWIEADGQKLPIRGNSVDTVFLISVLEHFDSSHAALDEVRRVIKPKGRIVLTVPREPRPFFLYEPDLVRLGHARFGYREDEIVGHLSGFEVEALGYAFHLPGQVGWELSHAFNRRYSQSLGWRILYKALLLLEDQYSVYGVGNEIVVVAREFKSGAP